MRVPLMLKKANPEDAVAEWAFVRDMPEDENGLTNPWHGISREVFLRETLPRMIAWSDGRQLPEGYVPETVLFLWRDDEIVGQFRIRHHLCDSLRKGAGHIGYFISAPNRGQGLGTEGLRMTVALARDIIPESEIWLRVNRDNPASLRVMQKNGGVIVGSDAEHHFVRIPCRRSAPDDAPAAAR